MQYKLLKFLSVGNAALPLIILLSFNVLQTINIHMFDLSSLVKKYNIRVDYLLAIMQQ